jgi:hypothetical protein
VSKGVLGRTLSQSKEDQLLRGLELKKTPGIHSSATVNSETQPLVIKMMGSTISKMASANTKPCSAPARALALAFSVGSVGQRLSA